MDLETTLAAELHMEFFPGLAQPVRVVARDDCKLCEKM